MIINQIANGGGASGLHYATGTTTPSHYANSNGSFVGTVTGLSFAPQVVMVKYPSGCGTHLGIGVLHENGKNEFYVSQYGGLYDGGSWITFEVEFLDDGFKFWGSPGSGYTTQKVTYYAY